MLKKMVMGALLGGVFLFNTSNVTFADPPGEENRPSFTESTSGDDIKKERPNKPRRDNDKINHERNRNGDRDRDDKRPPRHDNDRNHHRGDNDRNYDRPHRDNDKNYDRQHRYEKDKEKVKDGKRPPRPPRDKKGDNNNHPHHNNGDKNHR